jgi:hypothetical protein
MDEIASIRLSNVMFDNTLHAHSFRLILASLNKIEGCFNQSLSFVKTQFNNDLMLG